MSPCHGEDRRFDPDRGRQAQNNLRKEIFLCLMVSYLNLSPEQSEVGSRRMASLEFPLIFEVAKRQTSTRRVIPIEVAI